MTKRKLILGTLLLAMLLVRPDRGFAASGGSIPLPNCEVTRIIVQANNGPEIPKTPDEYDRMSAADKELYKVVRVTVNRECQLDDFFQLFASAATWGFSLLTVVALFFFIWGGFMLLISGGRPNYINDGKEILKGTVIGVIVVLTSWIIVNFYFVAVTGSRYGDIFPSISSLTRRGIGGDSGCRAALLKGSQAGCNKTLRVGCSDPVSSDGAVTNFQRLLSDRCNCGPVNGCFTKETAWCLWMFKVGNGLKVPDEKLYEKTTADSVTRQLLEQPGSQCIAAGEPPEPPEPTPPDEPQPTEETYCCVPQNPTFSCYDLTSSSTLPPLCEVDDPLKPLSANGRYQRVSHACNDSSDTTTYNTCFKGVCLRLDSANAVFECADNCLQQDCNEPGAVWRKGTCNTMPFPTEFPLPGPIPEPLCTPP